MTAVGGDQSSGLVMDGDVIHGAVLAACPAWMSDAAADQLAEAVVTELASTPGVTVLRGPDSSAWGPAGDGRGSDR